MLQVWNDAILLLRAGAIAWLYCTVVSSHPHVLDRRVNRLAVFCLWGDGLSLPGAANHSVEKVILIGKKYQSSL